MDLSENRFEGQIPDTLWQTNAEPIFLSHNDIVGKVPDDFCSEDNLIRVDDSNWFTDTAQVNCSCCNKGKCYMWDLSEEVEHIQCPSNNINIFGYSVLYEIKDKINKEKIIRGTGNRSDIAEMCLSPTGCYDFNVQLTDEGLMSSKAIFSARYKKGSEQLSVFNETDETDVCDAVNMCGEIIGKDHMKRAGVNHITQLAVSDLYKLDKEDSATYKALCNIVTRDEMYEEYEVCDGTLLQRYILLYFYYSQKLDFDFLNLARSHTCEWPGVSCDSSNKFIKRLDLSSKDLEGSIITEIGLLKSLEEIDLSNNTFVGTIDASVYKNLPI